METPAAKRWDAFISHASEDRDRVARPLAELLRKSGFDIWLDEGELGPGDNLREKIDEGMAHTPWAIVVLSPSYFSKYWTRREFDGLSVLEELGRVRILPVWHQVDKAAVAAFSAPLAGQVALSTSAGLERLTAVIAGKLSSDRAPGEPVPDFQTTAAFLGPTEFGPLTPTLLTGWPEYRRLFGKPLPVERSYLGHAVRGFFENGGTRAWVVRVVGVGNRCARFSGAAVDLCASSPGVWGNSIHLAIAKGSRAGVCIELRYDDVLEIHDNLGVHCGDPNYLVDVICRNSQLARVERASGPVEYRAASLEGGTDGEPFGGADYIASLQAIADYPDLDLICVPDQNHPLLSGESRRLILAALLARCEEPQGPYAILSVDRDAGLSGACAPADTPFAAAYYPWIVVGPGIVVPPVGHIAGSWARNDSVRGLHTTSEMLQIRGTIEPHLHLIPARDDLDILTRRGLNCLAIPPAGHTPCAMQSRTLALDGREQDLLPGRCFRYLAKRISWILLEARFDPVGQEMLTALSRKVLAYLRRLSAKGAIGDSRAEAYYRPELETLECMVEFYLPETQAWYTLVVRGPADV